jgi:adenosylmethionine-8-amino-7-oxononanoate aminotransferase
MVQVRYVYPTHTSSSNNTSGSSASEAAIKIVTQYFQEEISPPQPQRHLFIAREYSYHGATLGALDLSDFAARKKMYKTVLKDNMRTVPACHPFRNQSGMDAAEYVEWHRENLIRKVEELGPENVAAFIVEPVVGAVSA